MALDFDVKTFKFSNQTGRQTDTLTFPFPSDVKKAHAAINGFRFDYTTGDHNIDVVEVAATIERIVTNTVQVRVSCLFADRDRADQYSGSVDVLVIAELK